VYLGEQAWATTYSCAVSLLPRTPFDETTTVAVLLLMFAACASAPPAPPSRLTFAKENDERIRERIKRLAGAMNLRSSSGEFIRR
jgi:hypothetical protein